LAKPDSGRSILASLLLVASGAFIGTSIYALSGLALGDESVTVSSALRVVPIAIGYDVLLTPLLIPLLLLAFRRLEPTDHWAR
jgi:rod shape-determining protein MreD